LCSGFAVEFGRVIKAAVTRPTTVSLIGYQSPGGDAFLALSLTAGKLRNEVESRDHVVLIDTSASQSGGHRRQALLVLDAFLASLPKTDGVKLICVDVQVHALMKGFSTPGSRELTAGLGLLRKRVPLG